MEHDISDLAAPLPFDPEMTRRLRAKGLWTDDTIAGWVAANGERFPDRVAITWEDGQLTHRELAVGVERLAGGLAGLGLGKGDVVATLLHNTPEFIMAYFAIPAAGGIIQPVHMAYARSDVVGLLEHSGARAVICADGGKLLAGEGLPTSLQWIIGVGEAPPPLFSFEELAGTEGGPAPSTNPVGADCFLL
ncbi:MAG: class I adenylate-forming enzyme family protein, partial [Alphaproteobacteria bacterium]|nr:class I adenylate-forming enzyme family protein [Alphaproteobacteria bacterium]